jgi:hypothetical protein
MLLPWRCASAAAQSGIADAGKVWRQHVPHANCLVAGAAEQKVAVQCEAVDRACVAKVLPQQLACTAA